MKDDIIASLKAAMEHGASLEQAVASFVSAGYNSAEVQEAARQISSGVSQIVHTPEADEGKGLPATPGKDGAAPSAPPGNGEIKKKGMKTWLLILLIVLLLAILGGIGWMVWSFVK